MSATGRLVGLTSVTATLLAEKALAAANIIRPALQLRPQTSDSGEDEEGQ